MHDEGGKSMWKTTKLLEAKSSVASIDIGGTLIVMAIKQGESFVTIGDAAADLKAFGLALATCEELNSCLRELLPLLDGSTFFVAQSTVAEHSCPIAILVKIRNEGASIQSWNPLTHNTMVSSGFRFLALDPF